MPAGKRETKLRMLLVAQGRVSTTDAITEAVLRGVSTAHLRTEGGTRRPVTVFTKAALQAELFPGDFFKRGTF